MSAEVSRPNFRAPRHDPSGEQQPIQYHHTADNINKFSLEKFVVPFVVPLISSLIGAAASYTAIRKDIQMNQARLTTLEVARQAADEKINTLKTEIAVMQAKMEAASNTKRRR